MDTDKAHDIIRLAMKWKQRSSWDVAFALVADYRKWKKSASENHAEARRCANEDGTGEMLERMQRYARMCDQTAETFRCDVVAMHQEFCKLETLVNDVAGAYPEISELVPVVDLFATENYDIPKITSDLHKMEKRVRALMAKDSESESTGPRSRTTASDSKKPTVNERLTTLLVENSDAANWSTRQMAEAIGCAPSTITDTEIYKKLKRVRELDGLDYLDSVTTKDQKGKRTRRSDHKDRTD